MLPVEQPFKTYTGLDGKPLDNGYVYFGQPHEDPITKPVTVYWDAAGTKPAFQPLRTMSGYIMNNGTPANVFFDDIYSELVLDKKRQQVFYARTSEEFSISALVLSLAKAFGSSLIGFIQAGVGAVLRTIQDKLRETVSVKDFGAKGDGVTDDTAAIQAAFKQQKCKRIRFPFGVYRITKTITIEPFQGDGTANQQGTYVQDWDIDAGAATFLCEGVVGPVFDIVTGPFPKNSYGFRFENASWRCPTENPPSGACIQLRGGHHWATQIHRHRQIGPSTPHFIRVLNDSDEGQPGYNSFKNISADAIKTVTLEKVAGGLAEFDNFIFENITNVNATSDAAAAINMVGAPSLVNPSINKLILGNKGSFIRGGASGAFIVNGKINGLYGESHTSPCYGVESGLISTEITNVQFYSANTAVQSCVAVRCDSGAHISVDGVRVFDAKTGALPYDSQAYPTIVIGDGVRDVDIRGFSPAQAKRAISVGAKAYDVRAGGASISNIVAASFAQILTNTTAISAVKTINSRKLTSMNTVGGCVLRIRAFGNRWGDSSTFRLLFRASDGSFSIPIGSAVTDATATSFAAEADIIVQPDGSGGMLYVLHRGSMTYGGAVSYSDRGRNIETRVPALPDLTIGLYVDMTYGTNGGVVVDAVTFEVLGAGL